MAFQKKFHLLTPSLPHRLYLLSSIFYLLLALTVSAVCATPEAILQAARVQPTTRPLILSGEIRGAEEPLPLTIKISHDLIEYQLTNPEETILLKLAPTTTSLRTVTKDDNTPLSENQRHQEIRNTGVTYDDLSLGFLYWPHPHLLKSDSIRGERTWLFELTSPNGQSPYGSAHLWLDQQSGALLRMEGFNKSGRLLKRFEVISAQKIDGLWMLKEMRIETFDPETQRVIQRRYLDVKKN